MGRFMCIPTWKHLLFEWFLKTAVLLVLLLVAYHLMKQNIAPRTLPTPSGPGTVSYGDILTIIGLVLAGAVAGTFQFSYRYSLTPTLMRVLGHATTFALILTIGLLFEAARIILSLASSEFITVLTVIFGVGFFAVLLFDVWDLLSALYSSNYEAGSNS